MNLSRNVIFINLDEFFIQVMHLHPKLYTQ